MSSSRENDLLVMLAPLYLVLSSALLLFSCGATKSAQEVTVKVPDQFAGTVHLSPCDRTAVSNSDVVVTDSHGAAATSVCPQGARPVMLIVQRSGQSYRISPEHVTVRRAGDGVPVSIEARIP